VPKSTLDKLEIKNKAVFALELSLEKIFSQAQLKKKFLSPPKYPSITRDISLVLKEEITVKEIIRAIEEKAGPLLRNVRIADYYRGKQIPPGYRGLTISCLYRSDERTLTEEEINPLHALVCGVLTEHFGATIR
jgi:phenylalanyl-tRNA synthetase beta chain